MKSTKPKLKLFQHSTATVWVTAGGQRIPVAELEWEHLCNIINRLRRDAWEYKCNLARHATVAKRNKIMKMSDHEFLYEHVATYHALLTRYIKRERHSVKQLCPTCQR